MDPKVIAAIVGMLLCLSSSVSSAMSMGGGDDSGADTGVGAGGSTEPTPPKTEKFWIVTSDGHRIVNEMIWVGDDGKTIGTWPYWADPLTKWDFISTGTDNEYWIITDEKQRKSKQALYVKGEGEHGVVALADNFNNDADKKWKLISTGVNNEYWIVSSKGQAKENVMIWLHGNTKGGSVGTWAYWEDPATKWKLISVEGSTTEKYQIDTNHITGYYKGGYASLSRS